MATDPGGAGTVPVRMDPIAVLPVFFKLTGKRVVMAGGTAPAIWKAELLSAAGARVEVFAPDPCPELIELAASPPAGPLTLIRRAWTAADLEGAALAIGAIEQDDEAQAFRDASRRAGVPVNVIDKPAFCDVQFGTIVSRSPLVIGISTDGAAPVFGQAIRALVEAVLPQGLRRWAQAARDWRPAVQVLDLDFRSRRRFWELFADRALDAPETEPDDRDRDRFLQAAMGERQATAAAQLTLVGAGPDGSDEVTLRAVRALQAADVVFYGADIPPATVGLARREAVKRPLGATGDRTADVAAVLKAVRPGRRIVWLDRGNPDGCLRWAERAAALAAGGFGLTKVAGLGRCPACRPGCPAWNGPARAEDARLGDASPAPDR